ncbi:ABC transporter ATP-binding protein [Aliamphritea hakodatensis]|uniref:ABC transporter ATP-binding protein n=1 Tax=Aliamphritea hakodatensis TaxID=2895352 RepID=UPI0022FD8419|nr:ABC transporter ATP-binding protein [Aliamphritea hakodatensis]
MLKFFEGLIAPFPDHGDRQPPDKLFAFCRYYTRGAEPQLLLMTLLTASLAISEVILFGFMGDLVDWIATKSTPEILAEHGTHLTLMAVLLMVVLPLLVFFHSAIIHQGILGNYPMAIRWSMHRYLLKQSMAFYQNDFAGRIATKVMQTSLALRESITKVLDVFVYIIVYFTSLMVLIAQADLLLLLPMMLWLACYVAIQKYFLPRLQKVSTEQADARSMMTGAVVDSYTNIATVKLFSHTDREEAYARDSMQGFLDTVYRQMRLVTKLNVLVQLNNYFLVFSITALSLYLWNDNAITAGAIAIAVSLALRLNGMSQWIMWEVSNLFENIGTVADGMSSLAQPQSVQDKPDAPALQVSKGEIHFDNISFNYGEEIPLIEAMNLRIKPGEKVGLVGRSGAGKSTLVNLLMRFYDLNTGKITIDGTDIAAVNQESLRSHLGMVTQDTSLLHRSIRENIMYGRPDASEEDMRSATVQAQADQFIDSLSDPKGGTGYDAQVGERGVKLSGGQRQRIAIARVLLKDAPILLLDEATSALDSEVEAAIQQNLTRLMENKTVIAIAHRLSTIAAMDRLIVLDKGRIVEEGNHQELLDKGGIYAQLWAHQSGDFLGEA